MKNYRIIVDSCCDLTPEMKADERFVSVPLTLSVDGVDIIDDDTFDQKDFLARVAASKESPHSACPSPELFMEEYKRADGDVYVITLSSELSGSYNSAQLGAKMYKEQGGANPVHVFNSRSASAGEVLLAKKIMELAGEGKDFNEIVDTVEKFRDEKCTFFVLESLETLRKNGRLSAMQALLINTLNIKPIMRGTKLGTIEKVSQTRGVNKALVKMLEIISQEVTEQEAKTLVIAHCNNKERAQFVKDEAEKICKFKEIVITDTAGVSSMYANDGGIVVSA
ncbi:MAG: DegV family protein [Alistipes sp.]|nr:DegV family protein [Alistipes sp.]